MAKYLFQCNTGTEQILNMPCNMQQCIKEIYIIFSPDYDCIYY